MKPQAPRITSEYADALYAKATKAELNKDLDSAFKAYIEAAKAFLHLSRSFSDEKLQTKLKSDAGKALQRAEKIKAAKSDLTPVIRDPSSEDEQFLVLKKGSLVNGHQVPFWTDSDSVSDKSLSHQPVLSSEQKQASVAWRTPSEVFGDSVSISFELESEDIIQRVVADCSLCASIAVCLDHYRRHRSRKALPFLYPCDSEGVPCISKTGTYDLRVLFNGIQRRYVLDITLYRSPMTCFPAIDDQLPFHPDGSLMCMSTGREHELWPSLVEKAYLKLMGGYDFPGSNSSADICTLIGWIPDHIGLKSSNFQREQTWLRILHGFTEGLCVITAGTDDRPTIEWQDVTLLKAHNYAIIGMEEGSDGDRWLYIIDSRVSSREDTLEDMPSEPEPAKYGQRTILKMNWDDACALFESLYVNWGPDMFKHHAHYHGTWRTSESSELDQATSSHHTVYLSFDHSDTSEVSFEVWILLTRHRSDTRRAAEHISLQAEYDDTPLTTGKFAVIPNATGVYTNSPHVLIRKIISSSQIANSAAISVTASYEGDPHSMGFTISAYSSHNMRWEHRNFELPYTTKVIGGLTAKTSGGNYTLPTYMLNPQYQFTISPPIGAQGDTNTKAQVRIFAEAARSIPLNVSVVWSRGARVFDLVEQDVAASSGTYSYGHATVTKHLPPGEYTIVLSSFDPAHQGRFSLHVQSSLRNSLALIPQEGAGMYTKTVRGEWAKDTAGGPHNRDRYLSNPQYELHLSFPTEIKVRLHLLETRVSSPLNISIFPAPLYQHTNHSLVSSGPYSDALSGVVTPLVSMKSGTYIVVPSTFVQGVEGKFRIIVYSSVGGVSLSQTSLETG